MDTVRCKSLHTKSRLRAVGAYTVNLIGENPILTDNKFNYENYSRIRRIKTRNT